MTGLIASVRLWRIKQKVMYRLIRTRRKKLNSLKKKLIAIKMLICRMKYWIRKLRRRC